MDAARDKYGQPSHGQSSDSSGDPSVEPLPDIERILAELAGYSSNVYNEPAQYGSIQPVQHAATQSNQELAYPVVTQNGLQLRPPGLQAHSLKSVTPPAPRKSPMIDPATIFDWPSALRCVNKMATTNPKFDETVKKMIDDQRRNVEQWWEDRVKLIQTQKTRINSIKSLNEVLKSVGGALQEGPTPKDDQVELDRFDNKVYQASQQMAKAHSLMLKSLGVPFFGVDAKLIIANELQQTVAVRDPLSKAAITETEILDLQRKMIQYLEDMYKD